MIWTETQLAYLAGIIDGEGSFYIAITNKGRKFHSRIYVVNTCEKLINWLQHTFGGLIYKRTSIKNPHWKTRYEWILDKRSIDPVCQKLLPYLIVKRKHADIMINFRNTFTYKKKQPISDESLSFRTKCYKELRILNHRSSCPV